MVSSIEYLPAGTILNERYMITRSLPGGGFGQAYLARDVSNSHTQDSVLIKRLRPQRNEHVLEIARRKFRDEAKVLKYLGERHPQIPALFDYFEQESEFYTAQFYIEGQDLQKKLHLDNDLDIEVRKVTESQLIEFLKQTLDILKVVHFNQVIHRDIKPANLIWYQKTNQEPFKIFLIDFGCVKEIDKYVLSGTEVQSSVVLGTPFYMPPEQDCGDPKINSDIYALGLVAIQAVTGLKTNDFPSTPDKRPIWKEQTNIKEDLKLILDQMIHPNYRQGYRYQTASDVLEDLEKLEKNLPIFPITKVGLDPSTDSSNPPSTKSNKLIKLLGIILGLGVLGMLFWIVWEVWCKPRVWTSANNISIGEEVYFEIGEQCTHYFRDQKYPDAQNCFKSIMLQNLNNPETAIYYNNALALNAAKKPIYLSVIVPISTNKNTSKEILRGVAHAQSVFNENATNESKLVIAIADDANEVSSAKEIAKLLRDENKIIGVIGHNRSTATAAGLEEYRVKNYPLISPTLTVISPTSSSNNLNEEDLLKQFMRSTLSDEVVVEGLANYLKKVALADKVAIFYDSVANHPQSAQQSLRENLEQDQVVNINDLNGIEDSSFFHLEKIQDFNDAKQVINTLVNNNINHVVLFPNVNNFQPIKSISKAIEDNPTAQYLNFYGVTAMYNPETIKDLTSGNLRGLKGAVIALDWARDMTQAEAFMNIFSDKWQSINSLISWRTATSYDAMQIFIKAIEDGHNSRSSVLSYLQQGIQISNDKTSGSNLKLDSEGNRIGTPIFVELIDSDQGLQFKFKCEQIKDCQQLSQ